MNPQAQLEQAIALRQQGRLAEAEVILRRLLAAMPGHPMLCFLLGGVREQLGDHAEALKFGEVALKAKPNNPGALLLAGNALHGLGRLDQAIARYDAVLAIDPKNADVHNNRANALFALNRDGEARAAFDAALALDPQRAMFWYNRGNLALRRNDHAGAIADFSQAIALRPGYAEAHANRGGALVAQGRADLALADYDAVLALQPQNPEALVNRGSALMHLKRHDEALAAYDAALQIDPNIPRMLGQMTIAALHDCNWPRVAAMSAPYQQGVRDGLAGLDPLTLISFGGDGASMLRCARTTLAEKLVPGLRAPLWTGQRYHHDKLRIAYVSSDMHDHPDHPVGYLMASLLARHDKTTFEITVISTGQAEGGETRARIRAASDRFHDVGQATDDTAAQIMRDQETDIAIDLNGHTYGGRFGIFALRPAPVQATWLGFPGTTGADFIDYIIADAVVAPNGHQAFYSEKIIHLPGCVFPFDTNRTIAATPTRAQEDLPETGFVFCCFNRNWKITAQMFDIWMRLLAGVPGSVLWLGETALHIQHKLRGEAQMRRIDPARLVFAQKRPIGEHLARHALADLFLDTLPYNAHATSADALMAGLPVLTQLGEVFAGRVGASMVTAAGLPELVTQSAQEYEALALALARDPARLKALRDWLAVKDTPLFDANRFVRELEAAYLEMSARSSGASPA